MNSSLIIPVAVKVACVFMMPVVHTLFHKFVHKGIHAGIHRLSVLGRLEHHIKFLPDIFMIGAMAVLQLVTEGHGGAE
jgi:uncharacterized membrane protein YjgN (DUF898 family)